VRGNLRVLCSSSGVRVFIGVVLALAMVLSLVLLLASGIVAGVGVGDGVVAGVVVWRCCWHLALLLVLVLVLVLALALALALSLAIVVVGCVVVHSPCHLALALSSTTCLLSLLVGTGPIITLQAGARSGDVGAVLAPFRGYSIVRI
jgi:hypothetical protein